MGYEPFIRLDIRHDYFGNARVPIRVEPDAETSTLFHKAGLIFRARDGGADIAAPDDRSTLAEFAEDGMLDLVFRLRSDSAAIPAATDLIDIGRSRIFVLDPGPRAPGALHDGDRLAAENLRDLKPDDLISAQDTLRPPLAILRMQVQPDVQDANHSVHFGASARYWTYYILGGDPDVTFSIRDTGGQITFDDTGPQQLANGQEAASFRSSDPIRVHQRPIVRFELMGDGPFGPRVILPVLPAASPNSIRIDPNGPGPGSDIYVNVT